MRKIAWGWVGIVCIAATLACSAPSLQASSPITPTPSQVVTPTPSASPPPEHRIAVRETNGVGEFYDRTSGQTFVPRGYNYLHLADQILTDGSHQYLDSTFATDHYDADAAAAALKGMHDLGYNVVRVFLTDSTTGLVGSGSQLNDAYVDNVADFLQKASQNDIYVLFTIDWLPGGKYAEVMNKYCCDEFGLTNVQILTTGGVQGVGMVYTDLFADLLARGAPVDYIWAYELRNELYFGSDVVPLSKTSGKVTTANGKSYDMASAADKQRMMDEGTRYFIDTARKAIRAADPSALVTVGFFVPQGPIPARLGDTRLVETKSAIHDSTADFIDLHAYPGFELNIGQHATNFGLTDDHSKPIILGEFGAFKSNYATPDQAARALRLWQVDSCQYDFAGWLVWHWDTTEDRELWNAQDGDGAIAKALAPSLRPDACTP
jgi:Cellulase (glycosyl hydrolase family 5)